MVKLEFLDKRHLVKNLKCFTGNIAEESFSSYSRQGLIESIHEQLRNVRATLLTPSIPWLSFILFSNT